MSKMKSLNMRRKIKAAERTSEALQLINEGVGVSEVARRIGVNRKTLYRNLRKITDQRTAANADTYEALRERHAAELQAMVDGIFRSDLSDAEMFETFRKYKADIARLLGINRERATANTAVQVNVGESTEFLRHSHGLTEEQLTQVFAYMDSLPRAPLVIDASFDPPALSGESSGESGGEHE